MHLRLIALSVAAATAALSCSSVGGGEGIGDADVTGGEGAYSASGGIGAGGNVGGGGQAGLGGFAGGALAGSGGATAGGGGAAGSESCSAPQIMCPKGCADLQTDPKNCGSCGFACSATAGSKAACTDGKCGIECMQATRFVGTTAWTCRTTQSTAGRAP